MKNVLTTKKDILTDFDRICGKAEQFVICSNYIRSKTTKRSKVRCEIIGFNKTSLRSDNELIEWWRDFAATGYRMNSTLGLRLYNIQLGSKAIHWIGSCTTDDLDNAKGNATRGTGFEIISCERNRERHGTLIEDKQDKIDCFLLIGGKLRKAQLKCSVNGSITNS